MASYSHNFLVPPTPLIVISMLLLIQICSGCFLEEKQALLNIKTFLNQTHHPHPFLPSWTDDDHQEDHGYGGNYDHPLYTSDCCNWENVKCNNTTGRIIELHLSVMNDIGTILDMNMFLPLKKLQLLDLSYNSFYAFTGCEQLATLKSLQYLHLEYNFFNSSIFQCIAAFPSLKYLSLAWNELDGPFPYKEINHLQQLQQLDLNYSSLSGSISFKELNLRNLKILNIGGNLLNELSSIEIMTSLEVLSLESNLFDDSSTLEGICSLKSLEKLDLSFNSFGGNIPLCFSKLTLLKVFDISNNNFSGILPGLVISSLMHLEYLSLSDNHFEGSFSFRSFANHSELQVLMLSRLGHGLYLDSEGLPFPPPFLLRVFEMSEWNLSNISKTDHQQLLDILYHQKELKVLDLSSNGLAGNIPLWLLENNTGLQVLQLRNNSFTGPFMVDATVKWNLSLFDISNNKVEGPIPQNFGLLFPALYVLNLSTNSIEGNIPGSLCNLTSVLSIDFSNNNFSGEVPDRIGTGCVKLWFLLLSNNRLEGNFPSSSMNLTELRVLYLANNFISGCDGFLRSPQLENLDISNNELQGTFPSWIGNLSTLRTLDLSHNQLEGSIPENICQLTSLRILDLSENRLNGSIPSCSNLSFLKFIHLQKNQITGRIPNTLLQNVDLMTLDLRYNHLSGSIPSDIRTLSNLWVLLLGGNNLEGQIPLNICQLTNLTILDLSQNHFSGGIPHCLHNISFGGWYSFHASFFIPGERVSQFFDPTYYQFKSSLIIYESVTGFSAHFSGVQEEVEFITKSRINTYAGDILHYMSGLDLSCNELTGEIPPEIGDLIHIRALNLSHNHLQGSIPSRLSMLNLVESLDLSYNNLTGQIPLELTNLNSLSIFNVSYNNLSGKIPDKKQFATFDESNYRGNPNLCGPNIERHCEITAAHDPSYDNHDDLGGGDVDSAIDMVAFFWSFFVSYIIALLTLVITLYINPQFRKAWFDFIDLWILTRFYHRYKSRFK